MRAERSCGFRFWIGRLPAAQSLRVRGVRLQRSLTVCNALKPYRRDEADGVILAVGYRARWRSTALLAWPLALESLGD